MTKALFELTLFIIAGFCALFAVGCVAFVVVSIFVSVFR